MAARKPKAASNSKVARSRGNKVTKKTSKPAVSARQLEQLDPADPAFDNIIIVEVPGIDLFNSGKASNKRSTRMSSNSVISDKRSTGMSSKSSGIGGRRSSTINSKSRVSSDKRSASMTTDASSLANFRKRVDDLKTDEDMIDFIAQMINDYNSNPGYGDSKSKQPLDDVEEEDLDVGQPPDDISEEELEEIAMLEQQLDSFIEYEYEQIGTSVSPWASVAPRGKYAARAFVIYDEEHVL